MRRGFLAALGATPKAARAIIPHERTLSKPKADRLKMLNALRVNVSPIFGVFADPIGRGAQGSGRGRAGEARRAREFPRGRRVQIVARRRAETGRVPAPRARAARRS